MPADGDGYGWYRLGYELHRQGRRAREAEVAYRHAIDAGESDAWLNLGQLLMARPGREDDAKTAFRTALSSDHPRIAWRAASELGDMLLKLDGDVAGARECFELAVAHDAEGGWSNATLNLAYMHGAEGDRLAARAAFARFATFQLARRGRPPTPRSFDPSHASSRRSPSAVGRGLPSAGCASRSTAAVASDDG